MRRLVIWILYSALFTASGAGAQTGEEKVAPCSSREGRQFDFWIGEWDVTAKGERVGTNRITRILDGCLLLEEYAGATGYTGKSFNFYDESAGKWNQVWVDNSGVTLRLHGEYHQGKMVLSGLSKRGGESVVDRITWHNNADGTVRQVWDVSKDGGESWNTVFDGLYTKKH
jgi:hypothetical protein